ncbi:MAG: hypothetical protein IJU44_08805 [Kiritimatiellae bacterium]|nr:hypothetical protein [Kiritimatiellia bacterium]
MKNGIFAVLGVVTLCAHAAAPSWPKPTREMRPWVYNWWPASGVDEQGLENQCAELEAKGFGGFHVIHIYGMNGPDNRYRSGWRTLLSPEWVEAWNMAARKARAHGLEIDLTMGAGWCFGGPWITENLAASSRIKVKRAGPGGTGFMLDPYNPEAMKAHVAAFEPLFGKGGKAERPRAFYHDSYEYYGAKPREGQDIDEAQIATFKVWSNWCRDNGYLTRNEAHGSPANWLDLYGLADIPETEMFGKSRDILISKFASSTAHVKGTTLVSSETCTWIDEHFCERPAEIKQFIDRLFLSGVNHIFYHGMCYSPVDAAWPGWCFYASLEMNPRNPIWREVGELNGYITRCQSLFQTWRCDNDLLILWDPDPFRKKPGNFNKQMSVHGDGWFYGEKVGKLAKRLYNAGYAFDYISPRQLADSAINKSRYAEIIDPEKDEKPKASRTMPFSPDANGLMATRWRTQDGKTAYFVVNQSGKAREVRSAEPFTAMDPLSGKIVETANRTLEPGHSAFFIGGSFEVLASNANPVGSQNSFGISGPWEVSPVCGGPAMPAPRTIDSLAGWDSWDDAFSGTMRYSASFDCDRPECSTLDLGEVKEIARVRLNGKDLGVRFMPPYRFDIPAGLVKAKGNRIEAEVTNLGANRIRDLDRKKVNWKYFGDINIVDTAYHRLDASGWPVRKSGLLGPARLMD